MTQPTLVVAQSTPVAVIPPASQSEQSAATDVVVIDESQAEGDGAPSFLDDDGGSETIIIDEGNEDAGDGEGTSPELAEALGDMEDIMEGVEDADTNAFVEIFSDKCLRCSHLVAHAQKKFNSCHFSQGNRKCPAADMQIVIGVDTERMVNGILKSELEGDASLIGRKYAKLAQEPEWVQQRVMNELRIRRQG